MTSMCKGVIHVDFQNTKGINKEEVGASEDKQTQTCDDKENIRNIQSTVVNKQ